MGLNIFEGDVRLFGPGTSQADPLHVENSPVEAQLVEVLQALTDLYTRLGNGSQTSNVVPMASIVGQGVLAVPTDTPAPLASNVPCRSVTIRADSLDDTNKNNRPVMIGGPGVTGTSGMALRPGESFTIEISNVNAVYCIARSGNQKLCWVAAL